MDRLLVKWANDPAELVLRGEVGLPFGVDYSELDPVAEIELVVGGVVPAALPLSQVTFATSGNQGKTWSLAISGATELADLRIDWTGARYVFKEKGFPVALKSELMTTSQSVLRLQLKPKALPGPFAIGFDGVANMSLDADGNVLAADFDYTVLNAGKLIELSLPIPLTDQSEIVMSGDIERTLAVGEGLRPSVGRYEMEVHFDPTAYPALESTVPRSIGVLLRVGAEGYTGQLELGASEITLKGSKWKGASDAP